MVAKSGDLVVCSHDNEHTISDQEIEIEDLYPDYEELEENSDEIPMVTIGDVITQLEVISSF